MARADLTRLERSSATSAEAGRSLAYRLGYVDLVTVAVERATWAAMTTDLAELMAFVAEERCQVFFAHRACNSGMKFVSSALDVIPFLQAGGR